MVSAASIDIVEAPPADFPALRWLLLSARLPSVGVDPSLATFFVAYAGGEVVAGAGLEQYGHVGLLRSVVVHPEHRRRGLADRLLEKVVELARQRRSTDLFLLTETAAAYFGARGFEVIPRSAAPDALKQSWEFRLGCPSSATVMHSPLG